MPFLIVRNDITHMKVDAVVNAAKPSLLGGGGVDGAIHAAAGPELLEACRKLDGCPVGQARVTPGFRLPCRWVIHTVGPVWEGGGAGEREKLLSCYRSSLKLAEELGCESLAFPLISSGAYGYPKDQAAAVAREAIESFLWDHEMLVYLVLYGDESLAASRPLFGRIREYIDSSYVQRHPSQARRGEEEIVCSACEYAAAPAPSEANADRARIRRRKQQGEPLPPMPSAAKAGKPAAPMPAAAEPFGSALPRKPGSSAPFDRRFGTLDESFQQMLLRKIDERGITDAACYKRANIDRKLFSKIRKDVYYKPSKPTALAFAVALELDARETEELLRKAGFALSRSSRFDLIVSWFIEHRIYDVYTINEALFEFDQTLLGNVS